MSNQVTEGIISELSVTERLKLSLSGAGLREYLSALSGRESKNLIGHQKKHSDTIKPYWNFFSEALSECLNLPTKTGFAALGSILSHGSVIGSRLRYWFSTKRTSAQNEKWLRISLPLSTSSVVDCMDCENTKNKLLKTVSYRVYPCKELAVIWKKWVAAVRKVYNISIAYLNQHQGFEKVGNKGGKQGFRTMLKASGLIPQWCLDLNASKILDNASMEAYKRMFEKSAIE